MIGSKCQGASICPVIWQLCRRMRDEERNVSHGMRELKQSTIAEIDWIGLLRVAGSPRPTDHGD